MFGFKFQAAKLDIDVSKLVQLSAGRGRKVWNQSTEIQYQKLAGIGLIKFRAGHKNRKKKMPLAANLNSNYRYHFVQIKKVMVFFFNTTCALFSYLVIF